MAQTSDTHAQAEKAAKDVSGADVAKAKEEAGIATAAENAKLQHAEDLRPELYGSGDGDGVVKAKKRGSVTTRDDALDAGVPMLQGDPDEPQGPEDAFGPGPKRGDYTDRVHTQSFQSVPNPSGGRPIVDDDGVILDYEPHTVLVPQTPLAAQQGEVPGEKGGVTTTEDDL